MFVEYLQLFLKVFGEYLGSIWRVSGQYLGSVLIYIVKHRSGA